MTKSLLLGFLAISVALLSGCANSALPPAGSIVSGMNNRIYAVTKPGPGSTPPRGDEIAIRNTASARTEQARLADARCKKFMSRLTAEEKTFIRSTGATHLCVFTISNQAHKGEKSVMFWDTRTETLVGNTVYEIDNAPPDFTRVALPDFTVLHIGNGV